MVCMPKQKLLPQIVLNAVKQGLNASIVHPSGIIYSGDTVVLFNTIGYQLFKRYTLTACVNGGYDFVDVRDGRRNYLRAWKRTGGRMLYF